MGGWEKTELNATRAAVILKHSAGREDADGTH